MTRLCQTTHDAVAIKAVSRVLTPKLLDNLKSEIDILKQLSYKHITSLTDIVVRVLYLPIVCWEIILIERPSTHRRTFTSSWNSAPAVTCLNISSVVGELRVFNTRPVLMNLCNSTHILEPEAWRSVACGAF